MEWTLQANVGDCFTIHSSNFTLSAINETSVGAVIRVKFMHILIHFKERLWIYIKINIRTH